LLKLKHVTGGASKKFFTGKCRQGNRVINDTKSLFRQEDAMMDNGDRESGEQPDDPGWRGKWPLKRSL